jgi:hypothetical protein
MDVQLHLSRADGDDHGPREDGTPALRRPSQLSSSTTSRLALCTSPPTSTSSGKASLASPSIAPTSRPHRRNINHSTSKDTLVTVLTRGLDEWHHMTGKDSPIQLRQAFLRQCPKHVVDGRDASMFKLSLRRACRS